MPSQHKANPIEATPLWEKITAFVFGVIFVTTLLVFAVALPTPTPFQYLSITHIFLDDDKSISYTTS